MNDRPNILFMHSHNTGTLYRTLRTRRTNAASTTTGRTRRLISTGVCHSPPHVRPAEPAFLTGMYPHSCGMTGLAHRGFAMSNYDWHAARIFKANGYFTATAGVEHTAPDLDTIGYDEILSGLDTNYPGQSKWIEPADAVVDFIKNAPQQPFFLNLGLNETHRPFHSAEPDKYPAEHANNTAPHLVPCPTHLKRGPTQPTTKPPHASWTTTTATYSTPFEKPAYPTTPSYSALPTTDCNSRATCATLTDHGIGVYLIICGPGFAGGKTVNAMVSLMDLLPTAYRAAGIEIPDHVQGKSLHPLINEDRHREEIFSEVTYHAAYEPMRSIRTERYKYIRRYDNRDKLVLPNVDDTTHKSLLTQPKLGKNYREIRKCYTT